MNSEIITQANQNLTYDRLSSERYLFRLKHERETQDLSFTGREFQRDAPENESLLLNKSILGLGKYIPRVGVVGLGKTKELSGASLLTIVYIKIPLL